MLEFSMVVLRMDRSIAEDVIRKCYHLHHISYTCKEKKGAPGQILGGLLTILLMAAKKPHL